MQIRFSLLAGCLLAAIPTTVWAAEENDSSVVPPPGNIEAREAAPLPEPAFGGNIVLKSTHVDTGNAFRYTADSVQPVIEGEATYRFAPGCQLRAWGVHAVGKGSSNDLWEADFGGNCDVTLSEGVTLNLSAEEWVLPGPNIHAAAATITYGAVDVSVTYMATEGPNAVRGQIGVTPISNDRFEFRLTGGFESGFGSKTIGVLGATAEYQLVNRWSIFAGGAYGFAEQGDPRRGAKGEVGIRFSF